MAPSCGISYSKAAISWGNIENRSLSLHCKRHFIANSLAVCIEANSSVSNRSATKLEINGHIVKRPKILLGKTATKNNRIKNTSVMFSASFSYYCRLQSVVQKTFTRSNLRLRPVFRYSISGNSLAPTAKNLVFDNKDSDYPKSSFSDHPKVHQIGKFDLIDNSHSPK